MAAWGLSRLLLSILLLCPSIGIANDLAQREKSYFKQAAYDLSAFVSIPLGTLKVGGARLPVDLVYKSKAENPGVAGSFFQLPLLESCIFRLDERTIHVRLPGGGLLRTYRTAAADTFQSSDKKWTLKLMEREAQLTCPEHSLSFSNGKLTQIKTDGKTFRWVRNDQMIKIVSERNEVLLEALLNPDQSATEIAFGDRRLELSYENTPLCQEVAGQILVVAQQPTLKTIVEKGKPAPVVEITREFNAETKEIEATLKADFSSSVVRTAAATGQIIACNDVRYEFAPTGKSLPEVRCLDEEGKLIGSYMYDKETGRSKEGQPDGSFIHRLYFLSNNALYGALRKEEKVTATGSETLRKFEVDEKARPLRDYEHGRTVHYIYSDSATTPRNGEDYVKYGATGEVIEQRLRGILTKHSVDLSGNKVSISQLQNGDLVQRTVDSAGAVSFKRITNQQNPK